eukprot:GFYU01001312.1.p1 GENE.GFYU01001312.1~~GFYU01001312.1.p1  ORF type:complete len:242 (+),score=59.02 GFYU01001312.1:256-981(+)
MTSLKDVTGTLGVPLFLREKYQDVKNPLPQRWKQKQFVTNPPKDGNLPWDVCFQKDFKGLYASKKFMDQVPYMAMQKERKNGFGTSDATKRDEFCFHTRCEQYREQISNEVKFNKAKSAMAAKLLIDTEGGQRPRTTGGNLIDLHEEFQGPEFLHDVGRTITTKYCKRCTKERWFCPHRATDTLNDKMAEGKEKRKMTMSQDIGRGAVSATLNYESSAFARRPLIKNTFFRTRGVLNNNPH